MKISITFFVLLFLTNLSFAETANRETSKACFNKFKTFLKLSEVIELEGYSDSGKACYLNLISHSKRKMEISLREEGTLKAMWIYLDLDSKLAKQSFKVCNMEENSFQLKFEHRSKIGWRKRYIYTLSLQKTGAQLSTIYMKEERKRGRFGSGSNFSTSLICHF